MDMSMTVKELDEQLEKDFDYVMDIADRQRRALLEDMIIIKKLGLKEVFEMERLALRKEMAKPGEDE